MLDPVWEARPRLARQLLQRLKNVINWAAARDYRPQQDPQLWLQLNVALPKPKKLRTHHHAALPWQEVPQQVVQLQRTPACDAARSAVLFLLMTACRSGEVRHMRWEEVDFARRTWTIPASRMKAGVLHRVPLSSQALALLRNCRGAHREWVFVSPRGKPFSDNGLLKLLRRAGCEATIHGLRANFGTGLPSPPPTRAKWPSRPWRMLPARARWKRPIFAATCSRSGAP